MDIKCSYIDYNIFGYTCKVKNQDIPLGAKLEFIGTHEIGKVDGDVKFIEIFDCNISKVPQGLTEKFPNLEGMDIKNSSLKDINRSDLFEYKNFKWLFFNDNEIKYLSGDLFADCKNLETISFKNNLLTTIEPNILDGLEHLKEVDLNGWDIKYGKIYSIITLEHSDQKLVQMKSKLTEEYIKRLKGDNEELSKIKSFIQADEKLKDFRINIDDKQFPVHKIFLAARSPTLAEMMRNSPEAEYLNLVDISVDIFEDILKFLYTDEFPRETNFMQLFAAAKRLKILKLNEYAAEVILDQLDHENALEVLNLGNIYRHDEMKSKAFEKIKQKFSNIELRDEWLNQDEIIEQIVKHFQKIQEIEKEFQDSIKNYVGYEIK